MEQDVVRDVSAVFSHHMSLIGTEKLDELIQDYSSESVVMSPERSFLGLEQIRAFYQAASAGLPPGFAAAFTVLRQDIQGEIVYMVWKAEPFVKSGMDTFVIRDGKILAHTFLMV